MLRQATYASAEAKTSSGNLSFTLNEGWRDWALGHTTKKTLHGIMTTMVLSGVEVVVSPKADRETAVKYCSGFASGDQTGKDFFEHYPEATMSFTVDEVMANLTEEPRRNTSFGTEFLSERFLHAYAALKKSRGEPVSPHLPWFIPMDQFTSLAESGKWYYTGALAVPEAIEWTYRQGACGLVARKRPVFFPYSDRPAENQDLQPLWNAAGFTSEMVAKINNPGKFTVLNAPFMAKEGHVWKSTVAKLGKNVEKLSKGVEGFDVDAAVKALLNYRGVHPVGDCIGETSEKMTGQDFIEGMQQHGFDFATAIHCCGWVLLNQECVAPQSLRCVGFLPAGEVYHIHIDDKLLTPRGKVELADGSQKRVDALIVGDVLKDEGGITSIEVWPRYTGVYHWDIDNLQHHNDILAARKAAAARHYYGEAVSGVKRSSSAVNPSEKRVRFQTQARAISSRHFVVDDSESNLKDVKKLGFRMSRLFTHRLMRRSKMVRKCVGLRQRRHLTAKNPTGFSITRQF